MESIESVAREGLACAVHMELEVCTFVFTTYLSAALQKYNVFCTYGA